MTISVQMEASSVIEALKKVTDNLPKQMSIVSMKAARTGKSAIAKIVSGKIMVTQATVKKKITVKRVGPTGAEVTLDAAQRINLRHFGARQTKKGVGYKIDRGGKRKTVVGAFQGPRPGRMNIKWKGMPFIRDNLANNRSTIRPLGWGPSPYGVLKKNDQVKVVEAIIRAELRKQMAERLRYLTLKKSGTI